jgi:hypothetical protein
MIDKLDHPQFEPFHTEEELWSYAGITRRNFLLLDSASQGAIEYACKINIRRRIGLSDKEHDAWSMPSPVPEPAEPDTLCTASNLARLSLLDTLKGLKNDDAMIVIGAIAAMEKCQKSPRCSRVARAACDCQIAFKKSLIDIYEVAFDRDLSPEIPSLERFGNLGDMPIGITTSEITSQLARLAIKEIDTIESDVNFSLIAASGLNKVDEAVDYLLKKDETLALHQAGEELKRRLCLAKLIIQPQICEEERNEWFKAIGLAGLACEALRRAPQEYIEIKTNCKALKSYLQVLAGLLLHYSNTNQDPDWELLAQLMLGAIQSHSSREVRYESPASTIHKTLFLAKGSSVHELDLWKTSWSKRDPRWAAVPDSDKCPITALHLLLDSIGPVKDWSVATEHSAMPQVVVSLQSLAYFAEELSRTVLNYFDTMKSKTKPPFPYMGRNGVTKDNAIIITMYDCMSLCRQIKRAAQLGELFPEHPVRNSWHHPLVD